MSITRRKFIGASAALTAVATIPLPRVQSLQVGKLPWVGLSEEDQEQVRHGLRERGINPNLTYRVDFHRSHLVVHQFHGSRAHRACGGGNDVCRVQPYEVTL